MLNVYYQMFSTHNSDWHLCLEAEPTKSNCSTGVEVRACRQSRSSRVLQGEHGLCHGLLAPPSSSSPSHFHTCGLSKPFVMVCVFHFHITLKKSRPMLLSLLVQLWCFLSSVVGWDIRCKHLNVGVFIHVRC